MADIEGFWKDAPDVVLNIEPTWDEFIESISGRCISKNLPKSPEFNNADYILPSDNVIIELKEIQTEFSKQPRFFKEYGNLIRRVIKKDPEWRPVLFGGDGSMPDWFDQEILRIFRPPLARILKKANKQIKETKNYYKIDNNRGVIVIANDGFNAIKPMYIIGIISNLLQYSYSSIDCIVYITVNRYLEMDNSGVPRLLWAPVYSDKVEENFHGIINDLGRKWFSFLDTKIGFTMKKKETDNLDPLISMTPVMLPNE